MNRDLLKTKLKWYFISLQEIEASEVEDSNTEMMPLGSLQKGSIDIIGASVTIGTNFHRPQGQDGLEYLIRIENQDNSPFEVGNSPKVIVEKVVP